ncbi:hypothetical protein GF359_09840 [candidate division WOR-3 bacterium]|uniref:DUF3160 domain-containing protein n=1 Tax=candidate division WOR-3 bacterium TaxID=2052148 RepID=A0A9D5QDX5_UNCW3|nr:hypothetical protein [candidate division WOR-3 bacterium]MBD3365501.1 hypothetical protein [candidate division WOR-3 bacterium]
MKKLTGLFSFAAGFLFVNPAFLAAEDIPVRDFVSLGIYAQTVREYYLFPESAGDLWYDSTRFTLEWMNNALFDCGAGEDLRNRTEELRELLLSKKRSHTLETYFELSEDITEFASFDSVAQAAYLCGTYLGQLRFYLPRYLSTEEDILAELYGRLAEIPCSKLKRIYPCWGYMIEGYHSRTAGNPLDEFLRYLNDTCNRPIESTAQELSTELKKLLGDAARVISDF